MLLFLNRELILALCVAQCNPSADEKDLSVAVTAFKSYDQQIVVVLVQILGVDFVKICDQYLAFYEQIL